MALIGTLRNKMGKFVVGIIAVAIMAFVLNDLFGTGTGTLFGTNTNYIGEIAGDDIFIEEYQAAIQERENNYILNFGRRPGETEMNLLRQEAWELLISRHAIQPQFDKVGVAVTEDEIWDMIQGRNVDQSIRSSFVDEVGNFDRSSLISYLQQLDVLPIADEQRIRWEYFRSSLGPGRERIKYENLLIKTNFITSAEAEKDYHLQNDVAEVNYLYIPYFAISDSAVTVTDSAIEEYYREHSHEYESEHTRSLNFVTIPVIPTREDSLVVAEEMERIRADFETTTEDSAYAYINSDGATPYERYSIANLPANLNEQRDELVPGQIIGPFLSNGFYNVTKIVDIEKDTTYTAKASHILVSWTEDTPAAKAEAREKAQGILNDIKEGASFAAMAREYGEDGTASSGGDLGWITSGMMVAPFEDAVFGARTTGLLNEVTETEFGYHIIDVTVVKDNTYYAVASVEREIIPGNDTQNEAYRKADNFANEVNNLNEFNELAASENLRVFTANSLLSTAQNIINLGQARRVITWLFRDASVGSVSEVFDLGDRYVIAIMTNEVEKGIKPLRIVREEIIPSAKNKLKGDKIISQLSPTNGSFSQLALAFGTDAVIDSTSNLRISAESISSIGVDAKAIGVAFSLNDGQRSAPIAGENGVFIIHMESKTVAPAIGDYTMFATQALQTRNNYVITNIGTAIKEVSDIEDLRYKFY